MFRERMAAQMLQQIAALRDLDIRSTVTWRVRKEFSAALEARGFCRPVAQQVALKMTVKVNETADHAVITEMVEALATLAWKTREAIRADFGSVNPDEMFLTMTGDDLNITWEF